MIHKSRLIGGFFQLSSIILVLFLEIPIISNNMLTICQLSRIIYKEVLTTGKRTSTWNNKKLNRYYREGRGTGDGQNYIPGIQIYDFASEGKVVRIWGFTTSRIHHLMSQLEKHFFLCLDYDPQVSDIKEQYILPLKETILFAQQYDIRHPHINGYPFPVTTDFYYCKDDVWYAVAIKPSEKLKDERVREKLEIERIYWTHHRVVWKILTEKEINRDLADNITWLRSGQKFEDLIHEEHLRDQLTSVFLELYADISIPFSYIIKEVEKQAELPCGAMIQLFKKMILERKIDIDLTKPVNIQEPRVLPCRDIVTGGCYA